MDQDKDITTEEDALEFDPNIGVEDFESSSEEKSPEDSSSEEQPTKEQPTKETSSGVTPEAIEEAVKRGLQTSQPEEEEEPELTDEQIDEYLKRAKYSVDDLKGLGLVNDDDPAEVAEQKVQVLADLQRRAIQEATATAQLIVQHKMQEMQSMVNPVLQAHIAQQREQQIKTFYDSYPALKDYEEVVKLSAQQLKESGEIQGKSAQEVMDLVATNASGLIEKIGGKKLDLKATPQSQAGAAGGQGAGVPKPTNVPSGGRSQQPSGPPPGNEPDEFSFYQK